MYGQSPRKSNWHYGRRYSSAFPQERKNSAPDFANQQAIAEVLGALDDKIAANTKISQTVNYLASALFRSALSNAEFSNDTFADLAQVSGGGTPSTKNPDFWDGQVPWATPTDITGLAGPY